MKKKFSHPVDSVCVCGGLGESQLLNYFSFSIYHFEKEMTGEREGRRSGGKKEGRGITW